MAQVAQERVQQASNPALPDDALGLVLGCVEHLQQHPLEQGHRLHQAEGYARRMPGADSRVERDRKLAAARQQRQLRRQEAA